MTIPKLALEFGGILFLILEGRLALMQRVAKKQDLEQSTPEKKGPTWFQPIQKYSGKIRVRLKIKVNKVTPQFKPIRLKKGVYGGYE